MEYFIKLHKKLSKYVDVTFLLKFFILAGGLYYFNIFFIGITDPKGHVYSSFLANHLDYIAWLRSSLLHTANFITKAFGLNTYVADIYTLKVAYGRGIKIGLTCIGYGLISFWIAFIVAQNSIWIKKLIWSVLGLVAIWLINCVRVAVLLIALQNKWEVNKYIEHHDLFNLVAYLLILIMIYLYYTQSKKQNCLNKNIPAKEHCKPVLQLTPDMAVK
jgi:exosortase/archaeosortase family protein